MRRKRRALIVADAPVNVVGNVEPVTVEAVAEDGTSGEDAGSVIKVEATKQKVLRFERAR